MKNNNGSGALRVPLFMMIGFACATFSQVLTASENVAVVHANSRVAATRQENRRDAYFTLARSKVA
jgi:hypothetical protein